MEATVAVHRSTTPLVELPEVRVENERNQTQRQLPRKRMAVMAALGTVLSLVAAAWVELLEHHRQRARVLRGQTVSMEPCSKTSGKVGEVEPVEWVSMAPEELPSMQLLPEDVVRITLVTHPFMASEILLDLIRTADPSMLYLDVQAGLRPPH
jgi:hypothetical protein